VPAFTVIMATYNRGRHILPSIQSVLRQSFQDFELLVVGDNCTDNTAEVVGSVASPKVRWLNLAERGGSQSFPNNAGIEISRGPYIAYIGHDDIWAPDHLQALCELFKREPQLDFAVSGALFHGPRASNFRLVTGMFSDSSAAFEHFFPPSSFGHRRDVTGRIGPWLDPYKIVPPVDAEFLLRAANAGMMFASTQRISVQKFAAGHRYLSYLRHTSDEQERMVQRMSRAGFEGYLASELAKAKAGNAFMTTTHPDYTEYGIGEFATRNANNKGIVRPELRALRQTEVIVQDNASKALDWCPLEPGETKLRWAGCNPRPKLLVPFKYPGTAEIHLNIWHPMAEGLDRLALAVNGQPTAARISKPRKADNLWNAIATFETPLHGDDHTVLELQLSKLQRLAGNRPGIGIADIRVVPVGWRGIINRLGQLLSSFMMGRTKGRAP
jgi:glycosyltransferase involved in cell wall biosynthesis